MKKKNELQIRPLRLYEVQYGVSINQQDNIITDSFTADDHDITPGHSVFYRLGNVIREYQAPIVRMIMTPVTDADLADIQE